MFNLKVTSVLLGALLGVAYAENAKLDVEVTYKPDDCEVTSKKGDVLEMNYIGTLEDGTKFDASYDRGTPFKFQIGTGQVIKGWDQGLLDMCVGEKRKMVVPPHLGYGDNGAGDKIPGGATLYFEVELMTIGEGDKPQNIFKEIDSDGDNLLSQDEVSAFIRHQETEHSDQTSDEEEHNNMINEIFQHEDTDKDGFISHEEFSGPKHDEL